MAQWLALSSGRLASANQLRGSPFELFIRDFGTVVQHSSETSSPKLEHCCSPLASRIGELQTNVQVCWLQVQLLSLFSSFCFVWACVSQAAAPRCLQVASSNATRECEMCPIDWRFASAFRLAQRPFEQLKAAQRTAQRAARKCQVTLSPLFSSLLFAILFGASKAASFLAGKSPSSFASLPFPLSAFCFPLSSSARFQLSAFSLGPACVHSLVLLGREQDAAFL